MPPRTALALERLRTAMRADGYESAQIGMRADATAGHARLFESDDVSDFYWLNSGEWYVHDTVEGA